MPVRPTIVLVHGAYADSSSWSAVLDRLLDHGFPVRAYAVPLRSVATDAAGLTDLVRSLSGPLVVVGHSYGGAVMTNLDASAGDVVGLVYVAAFALAPHESAGAASALAPGSTLGQTQIAVPLADGVTDTYIDADKYHDQFCADVPEAQARIMAVTQRPITDRALGEPSGPTSLWSSVPSWFIFGDQDRNIPVAAHRIMAERAGSRKTVEVPGASHVVGVSHPDETADLVVAASQAHTEQGVSA